MEQFFESGLLMQLKIARSVSSKGVVRNDDGYLMAMAESELMMMMIEFFDVQIKMEMAGDCCFSYHRG